MTPEEFRARRERLELSREQLGELLGVSVAAIRKYETGPERGRLNKIPPGVVRLFGYVEADMSNKRAREIFRRSMERRNAAQEEPQR